MGDAGLADTIDLRLQRRAEGGRDGRPLTIGIGGGSAAGKSTIAGHLAERLAPLRVELLGMDRFFKERDELPRYPSLSRPDPWPDYNHPDSIHVDRMVAACEQAVECDVLILEGILVLYYGSVRGLLDLALYVEADADERIARRIRRNLAHYPCDDIVDYYLESVRYQHERYNAPTREHADLVVPGGLAEEAERQGLLEALAAAVRRHCAGG